MSMKRMLVAAGAAIAFIAAQTEASAQSRRYQDAGFGRYGYSRPPAAQPVRAPKSMAAPVARRPVEQAPHRGPAPETPLTAEQLTAKAEVDELFAREPALAAAKKRPDPRLAKAAAAKHDAEEKKVAAPQARQAAEAMKRTGVVDKPASRPDNKNAATKIKPDPQAKNKELDSPAKNKVAVAADVQRPKPDAAKLMSAPIAPPPPVLRMPAPDAILPLTPQAR